jgi:hypothetical protein
MPAVRDVTVTTRGRNESSFGASAVGLRALQGAPARGNALAFERIALRLGPLDELVQIHGLDRYLPLPST